MANMYDDGDDKSPLGHTRRNQDMIIIHDHDDNEGNQQHAVHAYIHLTLTKCAGAAAALSAESNTQIDAPLSE